MVPSASPIPGPQPGSLGPPTATLTGAVGVPGASAAHCGALFSKLACTSAVDASVQVPVPRQAPPHPEKLESWAGWAVSATAVPDCAVMEHAPGQSMPAGLEVTRPEPVPLRTTLTWNVHGGVAVKVAVTW